MIIGGIYGFLAGLALILNGGFFVYHGNYTYHWTRTGWGWTELVLGAVVFAAGVCVLLGMMWARVVGIVLASFSAIASFMFLPFYPLWSIVAIAVDIFIIWALVKGTGRRQDVY
jgi:tryptophan-rich sensory protein